MFKPVPNDSSRYVSRWKSGLALMGGLCVLCAGPSQFVLAVPLPAGQPPAAPFVRGAIQVVHYDQSEAVGGQDLLTAGLGARGIAAAAPAAPATHTALSLRQLAIYSNYRALVDPSDAGGFGRLYGPNVDIDGKTEPPGKSTDGRINGVEYIAQSQRGGDNAPVTMMVQVPDSFDPDHPCIVAAPSSGSRGIYGAIATAGDWGLKHRCAVAYTDKGGGAAYIDLDQRRSIGLDGRVTALGDDRAREMFRIDTATLDAYHATPAPNNQFRISVKHAHSGQNPERSWGEDTLDAIRFAYHVLNWQFAPVPSATNMPRIRQSNTIVIASSISNGGGAVLQALERDDEKLINGVAISEPQVQVRSQQGITITQSGMRVAVTGKPLADYMTLAYVYQACAALSEHAAPGAFLYSGQNLNQALARCAQLHAKGLLLSEGLSAQAEESLQILHGYGYLVDSDFLHPQHFLSATNLIVTYINAYGRFGVNERPCGYSFANTSAAGDPIAQNDAAFAAIAASGNGVPASIFANGGGSGAQVGAVHVVYDQAVGGASRDMLAQSRRAGGAADEGVRDFGLDGALCLRSLVLGRDATTNAIDGGMPLKGNMEAWSRRVRAGIDEVLIGARTRGVPTIIVAGRADALVPVNHAARAYVALNSVVEPNASNVRYYEVTNAQHFDAFLPLPVYNERLIPLHIYVHRALDLMWAHLAYRQALPPSQLIRTQVRGAGAPALEIRHLPGVQVVPDKADMITVDQGVLALP